jgi:hypothetical protein
MKNVHVHVVFNQHISVWGLTLFLNNFRFHAEPTFTNQTQMFVQTLK